MQKKGHVAKVFRSRQPSKILKKQPKAHSVNQDYTCICTTDIDNCKEEEDAYTMFIVVFGALEYVSRVWSI